MSLETRLTKLETKTLFTSPINLNIDLSVLSDEELFLYEEKLDQNLIARFSEKKFTSFKNWLESLPDEKLDALANEEMFVNELKLLGMA